MFVLIWRQCLAGRRALANTGSSSFVCRKKQTHPSKSTARANFYGALDLANLYVSSPSKERGATAEVRLVECRFVEFYLYRLALNDLG